jgi:hypothetical protein
MSLQEDAHSRKISTEVMKRCLYRQEVPGRRRAYSKMYSSVRASTDGSSSQSYARMFQSLPPTPARSLAVSPAHSPTNVPNGRGNFYSFLSRGATPRAMTPEPEEDCEEPEEPECDAGLASLLRPQPRYVTAFPGRLDESVDESADGCQDFMASGFGAVPRSGNSHFRNLNTKLCHNQMS